MSAQTDLLQPIMADLFAGGGGFSVGASLAMGNPVYVAVNHDPDAVSLHARNHPHTKHYIEDVWQVDPLKATDGRKVGWAHLSPDCKHHSKARGGKPVEKKIRGLAWVALRWAATVRPGILSLENVEEFVSWGPVRRGRPVKIRRGTTFHKFVAQLEQLGYKVEWRELRACDFGAPTTRKRLFLLARCDGKSIVWPAPTHGDPKSEAVRSGKLLPWRTAAEIIDWSIPCPSIFTRQKPLVENTMRRVACGLDKFTIKSREPFIVQVNHSGAGFRGQEVDAPLPTITSKHGYGIVTPSLVKYHGRKTEHEARGQTLNDPLQTVDTSNRFGVIAPTLVQVGYGEAPGQKPRAPGLHKPLGTVVAKEKHALVSASMVTLRQRMDGRDIQSPVDTITTKQHSALMTTHVVKLKGSNLGQSQAEPLQTITAGGTHFGMVTGFLEKYYGTGTGQPVDAPLDTVVTKDRFGLVQVKVARYTCGTDLGHWPQIRAMLNQYAGYTLADDEILVFDIDGTQYIMVDIGLRMLSPRELYNAQGFPPDYIIDTDDQGRPYPKSKQVARCGNAVPPPFAYALVRANWPEMCVGIDLTALSSMLEYNSIISV